MIVRLALWRLADAAVDPDALRAELPPLAPPDTWLWDEAGERLGLVAYGDESPEALTDARRLVGKEPEVYEEFDALRR